HRQSHSHQRFPEDLHQLQRTLPQQQSGNDRGKETSRPGSRQPVEVVSRRLGRGLINNRSRARNRIVQQRHIPSRRARPHLPVRKHHFKSWRGGLVHRQLDLRQSPKQHKQRENRERHPRLQHLSRGVTPRLHISVKLLSRPFCPSDRRSPQSEAGPPPAYRHSRT